MTVRLEEISVSKLLPNPYQVRKTFDKGKIAELADSIKSTGQVVPVMATETKGGFLLVAGERRLRAARKAGEKTIMAAVMEVPKEELRLRALIENMAREDLTSEEKEDAVWKESESGRWKSLTALSRALGQNDLYASHVLQGRYARKNIGQTTSLTTGLLQRVAPLVRSDKEAARIVVRAAEEGSIGRSANEIERAAKAVPQLATPVRKALVEGEIEKKFGPIADDLRQSASR